jgi:aryl-alcohol dehydrogenase-like predicted oxidoreductase
MNYRLLGRTGLRVSELCLGTMTFGERFLKIAVVDQAGANRFVRDAFEAGVNFIDTADVYSYGQSEEITGQAVQELGVRRDEIVIASKVMAPLTEAAQKGTGDFNNRGLSRFHIMAGCENSLRRLGTDHIDLYQVHGWDPLTPVDEILRSLDDLVRQGKVRYVGVSNWPARCLAKAIGLSEGRGLERFVSLQAYYSLVNRDLEHELLPLCREEGLAVLPWSPLSGGFLTGKYRRGQPAPDGARRQSFDFPPIDPQRSYDAVEAAAEIAQRHGVSVAQVALAWLLAQPGVTSVIIGANKPEQLHDNLRAAQVRLSADDLAVLSATTQPAMMYPQWMVQRQNAGRTE